MDTIGIEQARAGLGDIANRAHLQGTITILTRNGTPVAAVVCADDGRQLAEYDGIPHSAAAWRLADRINRWRHDHDNTTLGELPAVEFGEALAYADALHAVTQSDRAYAHDAGRRPEDLPYLVGALAYAREIAEACAAWSHAKDSR